jgi:23S rRNA (cytosine1962-C5)-methyltransferase
MLRLENAVKTILHELLSPAWMIVQVSEDAARMEGIMPRSLLVHGDEEEVGSTQVLEWGIRHHVDPLGGQKTGFYADQRENRRRVAELAAGRKVLDCHCYGGAFGLNALLRGGADSVTCIDSSPRVVRLAKRNAAANNAEIRVEQADAAAWLRGPALSDRPDMILLDPPKFVRSRAHLNEALKKYRKLNELAMTALPPGGVLVTSSCSGMVTPEIFTRMLTEAGMRAERQVHVLEVRGQAPDHPFLAAAPESSYLTCVLATVSPR